MFCVYEIKAFHLRRERKRLFKQKISFQVISVIIPFRGALHGDNKRTEIGAYFGLKIFQWAERTCSSPFGKEDGSAGGDIQKLGVEIICFDGGNLFLSGFKFNSIFLLDKIV